MRKKLAGIDEREVEERKRFFLFSKRDEELLRRLGEVLDGHSDEIIDAFYEHLLSFPETKAFFPDEATMERVKALQKNYFIRSTKGNYDSQYFNNVLRTGMAHDRISLLPKWYLGAYNKYLQIVRPIIQRELGNTDETIDMVKSFRKIILLDMSYAITAYIFAREAELRAREQKFYGLFEQSNDAIFIHDLSGRLLEVNERSVDLLGYTKDEIVTIPVAKLFPAEEHQKFQDAVDEINKRGVVRYECVLLRKDAKRVFVDINSRIVEFSGQRLVQMIIRDITERKRAEEELLRRKKELEALYVVSVTVSKSLDTGVILQGALKEAVEVLSMDAGEVWLVDENGKLTFTASHGISSAFIEENKTMRFTAGVGLPGIVLKSKEPLVVPDINKDERFLRKTPRVEGYKSFAAVPLMSKGRVFGTLDLFKRDIVEFSGEDIALLSSLGNIIGVALENAQLFGEIRKSEERYRRIFEATGDAIWIIDHEGRLITQNPGAEMLTGYKADEAVGRPVVDFFVNKDDFMRIQEAMAKYGRAKNFETKIRHKSGRVIDMLITADQLKDEKGKVIGGIGVFKEITDKKKLEDELKKRLEELEKFHKLTVGRELKMIELKDKIKELEAEIERLSAKR